MTSCLTSSSQGTNIELAHTGPAPSHDASSLLRHRSSYPTASFTSLFSVAMLASLVLLAPLLISLTSPVYAEESTADEQHTTEVTAADRVIFMMLKGYNNDVEYGLVGDGLEGLLVGGVTLIRKLKYDRVHLPDPPPVLDTIILEIEEDRGETYDFEEVDVYSVLTDAQKEANRKRYGDPEILTLKQATEQLHYIEGKLRELGVDPHSDLLHNDLRRLRKSLDTASDLSRSREEEQVSAVLKRLSEDKGVVPGARLETMGLIAVPGLYGPRFFLVEDLLCETPWWPSVGGSEYGGVCYNRLKIEEDPEEALHKLHCMAERVMHQKKNKNKWIKKGSWECPFSR